MLNITVKDIVKAVNGVLLCGDENQSIEHISIDSRSSQGKDIFVPIIGEKVDAHQFIGQAFAVGCVASLTSEHKTYEDIEKTIQTWKDEEREKGISKVWISVANTIDALHAIGRLCRSRILVPAVGVTGSVGKTTTREMIATALSAEKRVFKTSKNYNSSIGLPITLSEMSNDYDIAVLELGMNVPGELGTIAQLADIDVAVLTNIGVAHIEYFGTQEAICREKYTITKGFGEKTGMMFLNGDDPYLMQLKDSTGYPYKIYGTKPECDYRAENIRMENGHYQFDFVFGSRRVPVVLSVLGNHNVINAVGALAVADYFGVDVEKAAKALTSFTGFQNRLQTFHTGGYTIIDDTYNASPASMKAGLSVLCGYETAGRKIAVLGDMFELGSRTKEYHYEVGEFAADQTFDELILIGTNAEQIGKAMKDKKSNIPVRVMDKKEDAVAYLKEHLGEGDVVYLKASNGMKLKEITKALMENDN